MNANVTKTPYYKERVEKIEKEILAITNNATYTVFSGDDAAYLLTLLNDRKWLLDAMFVVTPEEFARMNEVNERLRELTHELHHRIADAHEKAKRAFLGKEFTVEATAHIEAEDMKRGWDSPYDYLAKLVDAKGNPVSGQTLIFTVNGKEYEAITDDNGVAKLTTSKLAVGVYDVTVTNPATGENVTKKVTIVKRLLQNKDLTKDFEGPQAYRVLAIGDDGNAVGAGVVVAIKVNGVTYKIKTDKNGYATLPIHLNPKSYVITATYHKTTVSNKIVVKQTMKLIKPAATVQKGKALVLAVTLKWSNGKAIAGKVIKFEFYKKTYQAKTDSKGIAKVTIPAKVTQGLKKGATYLFSAMYIKNILKGKVTIK